MASSFVKRASYRVTSENDIRKIPDVKTAMILLKAWGLEAKGLRTRDQALQRLLDHWKTSAEEQEKKTTEKIKNPINISSDRIQSNAEKLVTKFDNTKKFLQQLPLIHKQSIADTFNNIEETFQSKIQSLKNRECVLLVVGETGTGQSSFINLLLNNDILPVGESRCTKTFCQLKRGPKPLATFHKRSKTSGEPVIVTFPLSSDKDKEDIQKFITSSYSEDQVFLHEKIEIEFPFTFLENGIYVVDVPDTIDTSLGVEDIISSLPDNVVILYIIDFLNPDHVHAGKIEELIQHLNNTTKEQTFNAEDVIIVCNKCDVIPEDQLEMTKISTKEKLLDSMEELKEDQILYMSVSEERHIETGGVQSEDFQHICKKIHDVFLGKLENHLIKEYKWLSQLLKRALYTLKVSKLQSNKTLEERRETMVKLEIQIEKLEKESKYIIQRLHEEIRNEVDRLYTAVINFLDSADLKASTSYWDENQCPKVEKKWKNVKSSAENAIAERLRDKINEWELDTQVKNKIQMQIINKFTEEVELMENQMKDIGAMLACGDSSTVINLHKSFRSDNAQDLRSSPPRASCSKYQKDRHRLGDYICSIGGYGPDVKKEIKPIFKKYKKDTSASMMFKATNMYISCLLRNSHLKVMVAKYVKKNSRDIDQITKMIPDLIALDKRLMSTMETDVIETKETIFLIPENLRKCIVLQGDLDLFYVLDMLKLDYRFRDVEWNDRKKLGVGTFAEVYSGFLKEDKNEKIEVAIKVFKDPLQASTVSDLLLEDETLRELDHKNIIRYFGATIMQKGKPLKTYWIMIMASCLTNLKDVYLNKQSTVKEDNPGKTNPGTVPHEKAKIAMIRYVIQICSGLQYLHNKKLVHRDLKLENILVTKDREIKLTDVGLTKPEEDISGTFVGSPVYMAPEVHEQKTIYNRKADIYSLAMVLWEMWYGESINDELDNKVRGRLSVEVRKGVRPSFKVDLTKPPTTWIDLIQRCWDSNPKFRPKAAKIADFFTQELTSNATHFV